MNALVKASSPGEIMETVLIKGDLSKLTDQVENITGYRKEIDHALERIAAIERHLGIERKMAA